MLPHIGSSTVHARLEMARVLLDALDSLEAGETPHNALTAGPPSS
jgi:lactate dehydrogenase-like 2-hydroxyacid dehydrogenase